MDLRAPQGNEWGLVIDALHALTNTMTVRAHYAEGHPAIARVDVHATAAFSKILEVVPQLLVAFTDNEFTISDRPLPDLRERLHVLASAMSRHDIEAIVFHQGMTQDECVVLAKTLLMSADAPGRVREQAQVRLVHVMLRFLDITADGTMRKTGGTEVTHLVPAVRELLSEVTDAIANDKMIDRASVLSLASRVVSSCAGRSVRVGQRAVADGRDDEATHATNVASMTAMMAQSGRHPDAICVDVTAAALLHDIGHCLLPPSIQGVPEPLLAAHSRPVFQSHTTEGAMALLMGGGPELWVATALEHHRGVDGLGYPSLAPGNAPHELVRLVALANFFDRKRTLLEGRGVDLDQILAQALALEDRYFGRPLVHRSMRALGGYPPGTTVELSNRAPAVVTQVNSGDPWRPQVQLLRGPEAGLRVELRDFNAVEVRYELSIARAIPPPLFVLADVPVEARDSVEPVVQPRVTAMAPPRAAGQIISPPPSVRRPARSVSVDEVAGELLAEARVAAPTNRPTPVDDFGPELREFLSEPAPASTPSPPSESKPPPESRRPSSFGAYASKPPPVSEAPPSARPSGAYRATPVTPSEAPLRRASGAYSSAPPTVTEIPPKSVRAPTVTEVPPTSVRSSPPSVRRSARPAAAPVPMLLVSQAVIASQAGLDHRAGFILSMIDGSAPLDQIIDASGMSAEEVSSVIDTLVARGLIALG